jgi:hypothetical protein
MIKQSDGLDYIQIFERYDNLSLNWQLTFNARLALVSDRIGDIMTLDNALNTLWVGAHLTSVDFALLIGVSKYF